MASVEIKTSVSFQDLLQGVEQLELSDLEEFLGKVLKLRAQKVAPSLSGVESKLLEEINREIPEALHRRFEELDAEKQAETLSKEAHEELIGLVTEIEALNVNRMEALAKLAKVRQVSLRELMKQLDIPAPGKHG